MEDYCLNSFFNEHAKTIRVYLSIETETDPFEHTTDQTELSSLPIKAITTDLIASQLKWKMPGINTEKAKQIIIKKKYRSLIEVSYKIKIDDDFYEGWKTNGRMQVREEGDFLRIYCYIKKV